MPKKTISVRRHIRRLPSGMRTQVVKHTRDIENRDLILETDTPTFDELLAIKTKELDKKRRIIENKERTLQVGSAVAVGLITAQELGLIKIL